MNDRTIDITAKQRKTVLVLLARHLPNTTVWVYGSRAKWTSRPQSDLDMVVFATPEQAGRVSDLREAFEESSLPFRVDLFVWDAVPEQFRKHIKRDHVVLARGDGRNFGRKSSEVAGEWRETTLDRLGHIVTGKTPHSGHPEYFGGDIPFVTPTDLNGRRHIESTERCLTEQGAIAVRGACISSEAIMVSCIGSDMGKAAIAKNACVTNQQINSIIVESDNSPLFVYYNLSTRKEEIRAAAGGSAQPILNKSAFGQLDILLPPLPEQRAIAHILGTLDDKIELNRRMNETLEAMSRALFKSWFVDFDPVRAKMEGRDPGLPKHLADLFPDRLVGSELVPIPEGWEVGAVEDLAEVSSGKRPGVRYAEASDLAQVPLWGGNGPMAFVPEPLVEYPILLTGRVGTLGSIFRITSPCWPSDNTLIFKVKDKRAFEFLFFQLKRIDFTSLNRGSTQPLVTQTNLKAQIILLSFAKPWPGWAR